MQPSGSDVKQKDLHQINEWVVLLQKQLKELILERETKRATNNESKGDETSFDLQLDLI